MEFANRLTKKSAKNLLRAISSVGYVTYDKFKDAYISIDDENQEMFVLEYSRRNNGKDEINCTCFSDHGYVNEGYVPDYSNTLEFTHELSSEYTLFGDYDFIATRITKDYISFMASEFGEEYVMSEIGHRAKALTRQLNACAAKTKEAEAMRSRSQARALYQLHIFEHVLDIYTKTHDIKKSKTTIPQTQIQDTLKTCHALASSLKNGDETKRNEFDTLASILNSPVFEESLERSLYNLDESEDGSESESI